MSMEQYFDSCTAKNAPVNALQVYAWLHSKAIQRVKYAAHTTSLTDQDKTSQMLVALAEEAFALHFLQDVFAAGHAAGTWGKSALKKGTHDHYNEKGLEIQTWNGKRMVIRGDAWLDDASAEMIAQIVALSLEQFLSASLTQHQSVNADAEGVLENSGSICAAQTLPMYRYDVALLEKVMREIPMPGLVKGPGSLPRTGAELGPFLGLSAGVSGSSLSGGFGNLQTNRGAVAGLEANIIFGLGMEGVLNRSGDGLFFIKLGWKQQTASTNKIVYDPDPSAFTSTALASAIPARTAYSVRIRMPYYLLPGDLLLAAPVLLLTSPATLKKMAVKAANGGALGIQSGIHTPIGRFQFMLGREMGISFFGLKTPKDFIILNDGNKTSIVEFRSTYFDFPILEYIPVRSFTENQTSSIAIQLSMGLDVPHRARMIYPDTDPVPPLKPIWHTSLRFVFNWRKYL